MVDNVFQRSPLAGPQPKPRTLDPVTAPQGIDPGQDPKRAMEDLARQSGVPVNVLMSVSESAGAKDPGEAYQIAVEAAATLSPSIKAGKSAKDALTEIMGPDSAPQVDQIMTRAWDIAGEMYPNRVKPSQPQGEQGILGTAGEVASDTAAQLAGGVVQGVGIAVRGVGDAGAKALDETLNRNPASQALDPVTGLLNTAGAAADWIGGGKNVVGDMARGAAGYVKAGQDLLDMPNRALGRAITGSDAPVRTPNPLRGAGEAISDWGQQFAEDHTSEAGKQAMQNSQIEGNLTDPSTWKFGDDPSIRGIYAQAVGVFGQMVPIVAATLLSRGKALQAILPEAIGAAQTAGDAAQNAEQLVDQMAQTRDPSGKSVLEAQSTLYRQLLAEGRTPAEALALTKQEAAKTAALITAPLGALGARLTGKIIDPAEHLLGKAASGRLGQIAGRGALGAAEEGLQETAETMSANIATGQATGAHVDPMENTLAAAILGSLGGGATGAGAGVFAKTGGEEAPGAPSAGGSPSDLGAPSGDPGSAPTLGLPGGTGAAPGAGPTGPGAGPSGPFTKAAGAGPQRPTFTPGARYTVNPGAGFAPFEAEYVGDSAHGAVFRDQDGEENIIPHDEITRGSTRIDPLGDTGTAQEPPAQEPPAEEPAAEEPAPEQPAPEEPAAPQPSATQQATDATAQAAGMASPDPKTGVFPPDSLWFKPFVNINGRPFADQKQAVKAARKRLGHNQFEIIAMDDGFAIAPLVQHAPGRPKAPEAKPKKPAAAAPQAAPAAQPTPEPAQPEPAPAAPQEPAAPAAPSAAGPAAARPGPRTLGPKPGMGASTYTRPDTPEGQWVNDLAANLPEDWHVNYRPAVGESAAELHITLPGERGKPRTTLTVPPEKIGAAEPGEVAAQVTKFHDTLPPDQQAVKRPDPATVTRPDGKNDQPRSLTEKGATAEMRPTFHEGKGWTAGGDWEIPGLASSSLQSGFKRYFATPEAAMADALHGAADALSKIATSAVETSGHKAGAKKLLAFFGPMMGGRDGSQAGDAQVDQSAGAGGSADQEGTQAPAEVAPGGDAVRAEAGQAGQGDGQAAGGAGDTGEPSAGLNSALGKAYRLDLALTDKEKRTLGKYRGDLLGELVGELDAAARRAEAQLRHSGRSIFDYDNSGRGPDGIMSTEASLVREAEYLARELIAEADRLKTGDLPTPEIDEDTGEISDDDAGSIVAEAMNWLENFEAMGVHTDTTAPTGSYDRDAETPRKPDEEVFPEGKTPLNIDAAATAGGFITQEEADARLQNWKDTAAKIGKQGKNKNKIVISLFDYSGQWSQPWVDAGYSVIRHDIKSGSDIITDAWINEQIEEARKEGKTVVGVLAATPCTTFAGSGARWWDDLHDLQSPESLAKVFGDKALSSGAKSALEYNVMLVDATKEVIAAANPTLFHVLENPIGRIQEKGGLPDPVARFHPHNFGDPYTKRTQLWGDFNPELPLANVSPTEGSKMQSKLRGTDPLGKEARSTTPLGFSYAFFMANDPDARAQLAAEGAQVAKAKAAPVAKPKAPKAPEATGEAPAAPEKLTVPMVKAMTAAQIRALPRKTLAAATPKVQKEVIHILTEDYFAPGNVVKAYGGKQDRVISFAWGKDGDFSVTVEEGEVRDGAFQAATGRDARQRTHSTRPSLAELWDGPFMRARIEAQPEEAPATSGANQAVDAQGKPLVVYHATKAAFDKFDTSMKSGDQWFGQGSYFAVQESALEDHIGMPWTGGEHRVIRANLDIRNPYRWIAPVTADIKAAGITEGFTGEVLNTAEASAKFTAWAKSQGYDGVFAYDYDGKNISEIVAFDPDQITILSSETRNGPTGAQPEEAPATDPAAFAKDALGRAEERVLDGMAALIHGEIPFAVVTADDAPVDYAALGLHSPAGKPKVTLTLARPGKASLDLPPEVSDPAQAVKAELAKATRRTAALQPDEGFDRFMDRVKAQFPDFDTATALRVARALSDFDPQATYLPMKLAIRAANLMLTEEQRKELASGKAPTSAESMDAAAAEANPDPTPAQAEAGNYQKGHIDWNGLDLTIENAKGSIRRGIDPEGTAWEVTMPAHYGYIKKTEGADGEHVDFYMGDNPDSDVVLIVDQKDLATGQFDEHKVMLGFKTGKDARKVYEAGFSDGEGGARVGGTKLMKVAEFKEWLASDKTAEPVSAAMQKAGKAPKTKKLEDLGPRLSGARKDEAVKWRRAFDPADVTTMTLSDIIPEPNYADLNARGLDSPTLLAVSFVRAALGRKPSREGYKLDEWAKWAVKTADLVADLIEGNLTPEEAVNQSRLVSRSENYRNAIMSLRLMHMDKAEVEDIAMIGRILADLQPSTLDLFNPMTRPGWQRPAAPKTDEQFANDLSLGGDRIRSRIAKEKAAAEATDKKPYEFGFHLRYDRGGKGRAYIYVRKPRVTQLMALPSLAIARSVMEDPLAMRLVTELANDRRLGPVVRPVGTRPRSGGPEWRDAKDQAPHQTLKDVFGLKMVEWGNYVTAEERWAFAQETHDALMDMAGAFGLSPAVVGLNGTLSIGFGSRGKGARGRRAAAAHYEPGTKVINLTRKAGAGSLAHEWLHALDNFVGNMVGAGGGGWATTLKSNFTSPNFADNRVLQAFRAFNMRVGATRYYNRMAKLDGLADKKYWSDPKELAARIFESFAVERLAQRGMTNDFMASLLSSSGVYPTAEDMEQLREVFDNLMDAVAERLGGGSADVPRLPPIKPDYVSIFKAAEASDTETQLQDRIKEIIAEAEATTRQLQADAAEFFDYIGLAPGKAQNGYRGKVMTSEVREGITVQAYINKAIRERGWIVDDGVMVGPNGEEPLSASKSKEAKDYATWLYEKLNGKAEAAAPALTDEEIAAKIRADMPEKWWETAEGIGGALQAIGFALAPQPRNDLVDRWAEAESQDEKLRVIEDELARLDLPELASPDTQAALAHLFGKTPKAEEFTGDDWDDLVDETSDKPAADATAKPQADEFTGDDWDNLVDETSDKPAAAAGLPDADTQKITDRLAEELAGGRRFRTIVQARMMAAEAIGRDLTEDEYGKVEEAIETAVVKVARQIVVQNQGDPVATYAELLDLYEAQPILGERNPDRLRNQAFSTPAPLAYVASRLAGIGPNTRVVEPTAGNGMLVLEASPQNVQANEIQPQRLASLRSILGTTAAVTAVDATGAIYRPFDVLIANPPFGKVTDFDANATKKTFPMAKVTTEQVDHAIAWHTLAQMPDDGRAVLIVGGVKPTLHGDERAKGYQTRAMSQFYANLYEAYNVVDHFTVAGQLYRRQGAEWPVDVIVIDGRAPSVIPRPFAKAPEVLSSWSEVGRKLNDAPDVFTTGRGPVSGDGADPGTLGAGTADQGAVSEPDAGENLAPGGERGPGKSGGRSGSGGGGRSGRNGRKPSGNRGAADAPLGGDGVSGSDPGERGPLADPPGDVRDGAGPGRNPAGGNPGGVSDGAVSPGGLSEDSDWSDIGAALLDALTPKFNPNQTNSLLGGLDENLQKAFPILKIAFRKAVAELGLAAASLREKIGGMMKILRSAMKMTDEQLRSLKEAGVAFANAIARGEIDPMKDDAPKNPPKKDEAKKPERENKEVANAQIETQYVPRSRSAFAVGTLVPNLMQQAMDQALARIEAQHGDIDAYVAKALQYDLARVIGSDGKDPLFSAEQIDALAMAIYNVQQRKGFIIGDQTGIGKGRFVAAMLRYALLQGKIPVFVTQKNGLYADMVRDLRDIGMADIQEGIIATNLGMPAIPISGPDDLFTGAKKSELDDLFAALRKGKLPEGKKMLFTSYSQLVSRGTAGKVNGRDVKKWPERVQALQAAAPHIMLVLDESHTAGGSESGSFDKRNPGDPPSNTAELVRDLVAKADGSVFSSATYAKNPTVMSLYSSTDLALTVADINDLGPTIQAGGVPLQQVIANLLTEAGQYVRRQTSMVGMEPRMAEMTSDRDVAVEMSRLVGDLAAFDADYMVQLRTDFASLVQTQGYTVNGSTVDLAKTDHADFASTVHNLVAQFLLAVKVDAVADAAIEAWKAGEKPVISLMNTNGSILSEYLTERGLGTGADIGALPFSVILERYLERLRYIKATDMNDEAFYIRIPDDYMGANLGLMEDLKEQIRNAPLKDLTASPIDRMMDRMRAAGMKVEEISGRGQRIQDGIVTSVNSSGAAKKAKMNDFNAGYLDALVLTSSGSTGFSLHATKSSNTRGANDGKQRHLIVAQPHPDINVFVQTLGRVNRTGQISKPKITIAFSDIALEKRPAAVLMKKLASLNANTTASNKGSVALDGVDWINEVGDEVMKEYLDQNPDLARRLGVAGAPAANLAKKASGRFIYLHPDEAVAVLDEIELAYLDRIKQLDDEGTNPLEAKTLDLKAKTMGVTEVSPALGTGSPLDQPLLAERCQVQIAVNPLTGAQIRERATEALGGKTRKEWIADISAQLDAKMPDYLATLEAARGAHKNRQVEADAEIAAAKVAAEQARKAYEQAQAATQAAAPGAAKEAAKDAEQTARRASLAADRDIRTAEKGKADAAEAMTKVNERIYNERQALNETKAAIAVWAPGAAAKITGPAGEAWGAVIGFDISKLQKNPNALSRIKVRFAQSAGAREMVFPLSQVVSSAGATKFEPEAATAAFLKQFDDLQGKGRTEERMIYTGNLVKAVQQFSSGGGRGGQVAFFTDDKGNIRSGLLMPRGYDLGVALEAQPVTLTNPAHVREFLDDITNAQVTTRNGALSLSYKHRGTYSAQFSKGGNGAGRVLFTDPRMSQFFTSMRKSTADLDRDKLPALMAYLKAAYNQEFQATAMRDEARKISGQQTAAEQPAGASPGVKAMRTFQGAAARGWNDAEVAAVQRSLREELDRHGLGRLSVRALKSIGHLLGIQTSAAGLYVQGTRQIFVRVGAKAGEVGVLHHELIHAMRDADLWGKAYGLFTETEWRALVAGAKRNVEIRTRIERLYDDHTYAEQVEEMVAELYREYMAGRKESGPLLRALDKIAAFFRALANALSGNGFTSAAMVMEQIATGEIGARSEGIQMPFEREARAEVERPLATSMMREAPEPITDTEQHGFVDRLLTQAMAGDTSILGLVPGRALFTELGGKMIGARMYQAFKEQMDSFREKWQLRADEVGQDWRKLAAKNGKANKAMMDLMHDTTVEGIDPTQPFYRHVGKREWELAQNGDPFDPRVQAARVRVKEDQRRYAAFVKLRDQWDALPAPYKDMWLKVKGEYKALADGFEQAVLDNIQKATSINKRRAERAYQDELRRIDDEGLIGGERQEALDRAERALDRAKRKAHYAAGARASQMRAVFESNRLSGPYFPLTRYGKFFATIRDENGKVVEFATFESVKDRDAFARAQAADGGLKIEAGVLGQANLRRMVDPNFVAEVESILGETSVPKEVMDQIWQRWLERMPELSVRRNRIHRKGTPGYSDDAFRNFGRHMFHGSHQLARLKFGMEMQDALDEAEREAKRGRTPTRDGLIVAEMARRHDYTMNPQGAAWAAAANGIAYLYYLSMSPAAAAVNLTQTTIVGIPILSTLKKGPGGMAQATAQLNRALLDFTRGKGHAANSSRLTTEEKAAMREAYERGTIDKSMAHDLAGIADKGLGAGRMAAARTKVMWIVSWMFHHAERLNREVTFLAAYRMAKLNGITDHTQAVDKAAELTWKTHFDYQNSARPRVMQGNTAHVLLAFKNFQVSLLWRLFHDTYQAVKGDTPEVRREARKQLFGITAMMALHAGISGTWIIGTALWIASFVFGDDDDPKEALKGAIIDTLGPRLGGMLWYGVPGYLTGTSLSNRIGMPDLWFRSPDSELEGEDAYLYWLQQVVGAVPAIIGNQFVGLEKIRNGDTDRGLETMAPVAIRNLLKGYRYATEGVTTAKGDPIVDEIPSADILKQALGFTPAAIAEAYEVNGRLYARQGQIEDERRRIVERGAKLMMQGQPLDNATQAAIEAFNRKYPEVAILPASLVQSARARSMMLDRSVGGAALNPKLDRLLREERAPTVFLPQK